MKVDNVLLVRVSSTVDKEVAHPQHGYPPLPLKHIQAELETMPETKVDLIDCWIQPFNMDQLVETITDRRPDLVAIATTSFDVDIANELAARLRQSFNPILIGIGQGHYLNLEHRDHANLEYDAILMGEPEVEFLNLLQRVRSAGPDDDSWREHYRQAFVNGRRFVVNNPDSLPFPDYNEFEMANYKSLYPVRFSGRTVYGFLVATRGCPHSCAFCCEVVRKSYGKHLRSRQPANVVDELEHLAGFGATIVSFEDDSFTANKGYIQALCDEMIARGSTMPWIGRARVDEVDRDLLAHMRRAGCLLLSFGVESGCQRVIDIINKHKWEGSWIDRVRKVFGWCREVGIGTNAFYVIGNPSETAEEIRQTIDLAIDLNSDIVQVHFFTPYPGSTAYEKYKHQMGEHDPVKMFHYARPLFSLAEVSVDELWKLRGEFYRRYLYRPRFVLEHLWRYKGFYWHNRETFKELIGIRNIM